MKVFPNPANDVLNIGYNLSDLQARPELIITDLTGRTISRSELSANQSNYQFSVKNLATGLYTYSVRTNGNGVVSRGIFAITH